VKAIFQNNTYSIITIHKIKKLKAVSKYIITIICELIFTYIIFTILNIYSFSNVNELTVADAAIILGASVWDNKPSPVFRERINHGIWLYKNNYVKYLIFTGGVGKNVNTSESSIAMNYAIENSIPSENIFIEEMSKITFGNIFYAKKIIEDYNFNKIILVSDPLHMRRAIKMAKDFGLNVYSSPTPTTRYISIGVKLKSLFYELFFYIIYEIYKYYFVIIIYLIIIEFMFIIYYYKIFRHNCT
jgi:uncharacterized SAM-binding protein YcdF (DUF218 family)